MPQKLKPVKIEVDLAYQCPKCGVEKWLTSAEAKVYKRLVCDCCREVTPLEIFRNVVVLYDDNTPTPVLEKPNQDKINQYVAMLVNAGHKVIDAKQMVQRAIDMGFDVNDEQDFVTALFK